MKQWILHKHGALSLSVLALITEMWRGFLDAMFVFPVDIGDETLMHLAAFIFTLLFSGWAWALLAAAQGSRRGWIAAFTINAVVLVAIPISWLFFYCPADCRAQVGLFNLANTLNLVFGLLAAVSLGWQLRGGGQETTPRLDNSALEVSHE